MINRELIRIKLVQIVYAYYQNSGRSPEAAEKELALSLDKAYELYNLLLLLMVETGRMALRMYEMRRSRAQRLGEDTEALSRRFVDNRFLLQLEANTRLREFGKSSGRGWSDYEPFVRSLCNKVEQTECYAAYMAAPESTYEADRELWRALYRQLFCENEELDSILEEQSLYWNDDKAIVDTFVLKTINRFSPDKGPAQELLPAYNDERDRGFASELLRRALSNEAYYRELLSSTTRKWEIDRVALMDRVIMQIALAEILTFPGIPLGVSISEYVEMAKAYSTPKSGRYVNATLDHIVKRLQAEGKLQKNA